MTAMILGASILLSVLFVAPRAVAQAPGQPQAAAPVALDLEDDKDDGSYGKSVETTAVVLRAMIDSPRRYQRKDGPFVQRAIDFLVSRQDKDGSIHDPGADKAAIARQTRLAAAALALHAHVSTEAALKRALEFVGQNEPNASPWTDAKLPESKEALLVFAKNLLAQRNADKS